MLVEGDKGVYYAESHARARSRRYRAMDMNSRVENVEKDKRTDAEQEELFLEGETTTK